MKTRSRRWQDPASAADTRIQSASNLRTAKSPRTAPSARRGRSPSGVPIHHGQRSTWLSASALSSPPTFSITTIGGRSVSIASATCAQTPLRVPSRSPRRAPAHEMSWQGNPAHSTSTGSTAVQSTAVMSPRFGTKGKLRARIFAAPASLSATQANSPPRTAWTPLARPSYPEQRLPIFMHSPAFQLARPSPGRAVPTADQTAATRPHLAHVRPARQATPAVPGWGSLTGA